MQKMADLMAQNRAQLWINHDKPHGGDDQAAACVLSVAAREHPSNGTKRFGYLMANRSIR